MEDWSDDRSLLLERESDREWATEWRRRECSSEVKSGVEAEPDVDEHEASSEIGESIEEAQESKETKDNEYRVETETILGEGDTYHCCTLRITTQLHHSPFG